MLGADKNDAILDGSGIGPQSRFRNIGHDDHFTLHSAGRRGRCPTDGLQVQLAWDRRIHGTLRPATLPAVGNSDRLEFDVLNAYSTKLRRRPFSRAIVRRGPGEPRTETVAEFLEFLHGGACKNGCCYLLRLVLELSFGLGTPIVNGKNDQEQWNSAPFHLHLHQWTPKPQTSTSVATITETAPFTPSNVPGERSVIPLVFCGRYTRGPASPARVWFPPA